MSVWAVVPMKSLQLGKSRLSGTLASEERSALSLKMFFNVLNAIIPIFGARRVVIVSQDATILALARSLHLHTVRESRPGDLNGALHQGAAYAMGRGATGVLIVFGDLPSVSSREIRRMIESAGDQQCVVASPDRAGTGTNALFVSPPDAITFKFGVNSFRKHRSEALSRGRKWSVFRCPGLAFDVDRPEDVGAMGGLNPVIGDLLESNAVA